MLVQRQQVARALTAQQPAAGGQLFKHVAVAHLGPHQRDAPGLERQLHRHIGHQRAHRARHGVALGQPVQHHRVQQFIAVEQPAGAVNQLQAVSITIECHAVVSAVRGHRRHQGLRRGGAKTGVDVDAVGLAADGHHFGAQLMEHLGRHLVGRAMGRVDHHLQAAQRQVFAHRALAELDVAAACIVQPAGFAQRGRIHPLRRLSQRGLDRQLPFVGQFFAFGREKLDAVVGVGVV